MSENRLSTESLRRAMKDRGQTGSSNYTRLTTTDAELLLAIALCEIRDSIDNLALIIKPKL